MLKRALSGIVDFLYPKSENVYSLEALSPGELLAELPEARDLGEDTIAIWNYADPKVRELIWELKYRKNMKIAESLASVAFDVLCAELAERALFGGFSRPLLVPMPMSPHRRRERGWNQTEVLGIEMKKLDMEGLFEYADDALAKEHTDSQTLSKDKKERLENVVGSMTAKAAVDGQDIILLDDVTTTGATFREARRALKDAGAKRMLCLAIAH